MTAVLAAAVRMPDLESARAAAAALPGQSVALSAAVERLIRARAVLDGIAAGLSALQGIADIVESVARVTGSLGAPSAARVLEAVSGVISAPASPALQATCGLQASLARLMEELGPLADQAAVASAEPAAAVLQAPGLLRTLRVLGAMPEPPALPAPAPAAHAVADELEEHLVTWTEGSRWSEGLPALLTGLQALLDRLAGVRTAWLRLPPRMVAGLHRLEAHIARLEPVTSAAAALAEASAGGTPTLHRTSPAAPAAGAAAGSPREALGALTTAITSAASAAKAVLSSIAATHEELSGFGALGRHVDAVLADPRLRGPSPGR